MTQEPFLVLPPYKIASGLFIKTLTDAHIGKGRTGEVVDLPVQKDILGLPYIPASSLKGSFKTRFVFEKALEEVELIFGSEPETRVHIPSSVDFLDAFLTAIPARSLKGVYAHITSGLVLKNLKEILEIISRLGCNTCKEKMQIIEKILSYDPTEKEAYGSFGVKKRLVLGDNSLFINESIVLNFKNEIPELTSIADFLKIEKDRLLYVSDGVFKNIVTKSLVRTTRIATDRKKKIVKRGGLWMEEYIPRFTVFFTATFITDPRLPDDAEDYKKILESKNIDCNIIRSELSKIKYLIIGGKETIGKGLTELEWVV